MPGYSHPEVLVDTEWVADNLKDPRVRIIESNNSKGYESGHIPGALEWNHDRDMWQQVRLDLLDKDSFEKLMSRSGIAKDSTVVLYGIKNSYATFGFWLLNIYRHADVRVMNGGREKWMAEARRTTTEVPVIRPTSYRANEPDWSERAHRDLVMEYIGKAGRVIVDVRTLEEYRGQHYWPGQPPQDAQRGGHIPGAVHIPWDLNKKPDGTFKSADELRDIYASRGVTQDKEAIIHCTIGGRSNQTWFVLKQLLGYPKVRLYDGSWAEWGALIGAPIER